MGGGWFPKLVWPKHNMIHQQVKVGVANNDKKQNVGVARAKLVWQWPRLPYGILHPCFKVLLHSTRLEVLYDSD